MIRYAQLGMREKLTGSKELWMCYYCGECTATCPRQADPGEFMAAARRYAIARYDRLGLARLLYTSGMFNVLFLALLAVVLGLFLYAFHGPMPRDSLRLFEFIPADVIHIAGVIAGVIVILMAISGMIRMMVHIGKETGRPEGARLNWLPALWETIERGLRATALQARLRSLPARRNPGTYKSGLFTRRCCGASWDCSWQPRSTTSSDCWGSSRRERGYLSGIRPRLLGTLAGVMLVYGVTAAIVKRMLKTDEAATYSTPSDWAFLVLLWLGGVSGFALEVAIYLPQPYGWSYWMLLAHLVIVVELLVLLPFTKFAHVFYRTMASLSSRPQTCV